MNVKLQSMLTFLAMLVVQFTFAQNKSITGTVTEPGGESLPGATVIVVGTNKGVSTDFDGKFRIDAKTGDKLEISYVGFATQTITIDSRDNYLIELSEDSSLLDEVLVVAYGTASKESITGSISSVNSEAIAIRPVSNAAATLEGSAAGIQINNTSGQPGDGVSIRIRGFTTLNGSNSPLIVVDGVPLAGIYRMSTRQILKVSLF